MKSIEDAGAPETELANYISSLSYNDIPTGVATPIEKSVIDTVGVTFAGATEGAGERLLDWAKTLFPGVNSSALGELLAMPTPEAGLVIGTASHGLDYDDLSWGISGHPSVVLVPALLASSEQFELSGRDVITAYAGGFEVMSAIAQQITPTHYERGWHATATFGTFGAAAATAIAMGLSRDESIAALNMATSMAAGLKQNFGSMTKPLHAGLATRSGMTAASLANAGVTADAAAISGSRGFWHMFGERTDSEFSIGESWYLSEHGIHLKTYPCCYFTHTAIAAIQELCQAHEIQPSEVTRVNIIASKGASDALQYQAPKTTLEAKFSMEYTAACALTDGEVTLDHFEPQAIENPDVREVLERVNFSVSDEFAYDEHTSIVELETAEETFSTRRENPPGTFEDPLSVAELQSKFMDCTTRYLTEDRAAKTFDELHPLRNCDRFSDVLLAAEDPISR